MADTPSEEPQAPRIVEKAEASEFIPELITQISGEYGVPVELVDSIIKVESEYNPRAKNPNSSASGLMQLTSSTIKDNCPDIDPFNAYQNIDCGVKMLANEEYWRWRASEDLWLPLLPEELADEIRKKCWCFYFAKLYNLEMEPDLPRIGGGIIFQYATTFHIAVILEMREDGMRVAESNFKKCRITKDRIVDYNDPAIIRFVN